MKYAIKEIFDTLQGEGGRAGSRSVFVRFAGCNLWNGLEEGRRSGAGACAAWCDTNFVGGERLDAEQIIARVDSLWPERHQSRWIVLTGGEPALQLTQALVDALKQAGWSLAIETNGTVALPDGLDWITVSPKKGGALKVAAATELKVILPGGTPDWTDAELEALALGGAWKALFVQPQDPGSIAYAGAFAANATRCVEFVTRHPEWRLSYQVHKALQLR